MLEITWQEFAAESGVDFGVRFVAAGDGLRRLFLKSLAAERVRCGRGQRGEGGVAEGRCVSLEEIKGFWLLAGGFLRRRYEDNAGGQGES